MNYVVVIAIAVILWVAISLILVLTAQSKKQVQQQQVASQRTEIKRLATAEPDETWRQELERQPGVLGWILLHEDGMVIDTSDDVEVGELGIKMSELLGLARQLSEELGVLPPELMEWEGSQGSILVAFPKQPDLRVHLVLFLDTDVFKNEMRNALTGLPWEADVKAARPQPVAQEDKWEPILEEGVATT